MRSRATPSLNDTSAPRGCCRAIPSLSSAGLCTAFPKALVGRAAGAGSSRRRQGLGLALPVQVEGGDLGVVPLEVHEVEKVLRSLLLTFLPGRKQGVSLTKLLGSPDTEWWHKDSAPRGTWGQLLCGHTSAQSAQRRAGAIAHRAWEQHLHPGGARWVREAEGLAEGFKSACARASTPSGQRFRWVFVTSPREAEEGSGLMLSCP